MEFCIKIDQTDLMYFANFLQYRYNQPGLASQVQSIIRIVLNTLESQYHRCYRHERIGATVMAHNQQMPAFHAAPAFTELRMREQSQASFGSDGDGLNEQPELRTAVKVAAANNAGGLSAVLGIAGLGWRSSSPHNVQIQVSIFRCFLRKQMQSFLIKNLTDRLQIQF